MKDQEQISFLPLRLCVFMFIQQVSGNYAFYPGKGCGTENPIRVVGQKPGQDQPMNSGGTECTSVQVLTDQSDVIPIPKGWQPGQIFAGEIFFLCYHLSSPLWWKSLTQNNLIYCQNLSHNLESAFLSQLYHTSFDASSAIDNVTSLGNIAIVHAGDPYSFLSLALGSAGRHTGYQISRIIVTLRVDCCKPRFHDVQVTVGDTQPVDPLGILLDFFEELAQLNELFKLYFY